MSTPKAITGRQCRQARGLLKWNLRDLTTRCNMQLKRIQSFEGGAVRPYKNEMDEIIKAFIKDGIEFRANYEVHLVTKGRQTTTTTAVVGTGETVRHDLTDDYAAASEEQERKRRKKQAQKAT